MLVLRPESVGGSDVLAVEPPLDDAGLDQVARGDGACDVVEAALLPVLRRQERGVCQERLAG